jgi:hypothetical protein
VGTEREKFEFPFIEWTAGAAIAVKIGRADNEMLGDSVSVFSAVSCDDGLSCLFNIRRVVGERR